VAEPLRTGLVGCGKVGHTHAAALSALSESEFVAVCDRDLDRAQAFAAQYGVHAYSGARQMVEREKLRVVIVCTPHTVHAPPAIEALGAGAHVLVEKPMAVTLADCDAMLAAARRANVKLGVISQRRLYAPSRRVKAAIEAGKIGQPILGMVTMLGWRDEAYYRSDPWRGTWQGEGGGVLVSQAVHQLDLLLWFMGPPAELQGYWANLSHPTIEVEDTAVATLRFQSGALGSIVVSNSQNPGLYGRVHVFGANGAAVGVQTDGGAMFVAGMSEVEEPPVNDVWTIPGEAHLLDQWQQEDHELFARVNTATYYHQLQIQDFLRAVTEDRAPMVSGEDGRRAVELFTAIYRSQESGGTIQFPIATS
jgi:UDP-N-acetyl-2-amino-2-deoxyglucuronate dehydrogenase